MRTNRSHDSYARRRPVKKSRRRPILVGLSVVIVLLGGYSIASFNKGKDTPIPATETAPPQVTLNKDVQLVWPAVGQAAIGSVESGVLARSSDNEALRPTASMAKVITALAIMEKQPFEPGQTGQTYTLTSQDVANYQAEVARGGSVVPVHEGMVLTQYHAMQMMLIASGNNIADTLIERIFGSEETYTSYAQAMLKRMELQRTIATSASGFSSSTVSTPSELVAIGIAALKNQVIAEIVAQPQAWIPGIGMIKNTNEFLSDDGVIGIKTGTTSEAGSCLLFAARYDTDDGQEVTIVGVIMGDVNPSKLFSDSRQLLTSAKQGFGLVDTQPISPPTQESRAPRE